ncbi:unnamed protein product [Cryptosporidium hominis]|uniref:Uncharacterized protein n=1 Tax=Cryptosporidium hominis TaxID=237895 RepID=A0A0S4TL88_CRYHO|nr:hypothetical protein [Cryptosporidium hominis TU502]OLQ18185.1 hypothetical protein ChTU502y2012_407g2565 [Cryptosporidium hominis]PPA65944.1 hypothetical protein ChUKH1_15360 [Cryptosporidium hominis]PPS95656.1 Uncharacterized protein GY17_00002405 [Cryptosporidium hominis]CUV07509.1 unnamed protein product [Cryptosporidium hominis]|eukprot:PPS95656.1 Uncharacterized protein GY17_00002405 [Cryptosporidium hominis]
MDVTGQNLSLFEENEDSIVDFITILTSVVQDSNEFLNEDQKKVTKEKIKSGILRTINSRSSLSLIDFDYNKENNFNSLINQIPDILEIRDAISTGCIDLDDFEVLTRTFKSITEMCRPENISIFINKNIESTQKSQNYFATKEFIYENSINEASWHEKKSLFPSFILSMFDMITKYSHFFNIRIVMFQICREIANILINCNWKDDNVLTWLSRPVLSDLIISLANCTQEGDVSEPNENIQKRKQSCSSCYIREAILSSIFSKVLETFNIISKNKLLNGVIEINIIDNFSLCFSISNHIIQQYHPNCYLEQVNSNSEKGYKSWWALKSEIFNLIQMTKQSCNKDFVTLTQISLYFLNQIDSSHLTLKRISTKNQLYKNLSLNKQISNGCFFNEYLYGNIEVDLPACLQSILFNA